MKRLLQIVFRAARLTGFLLVSPVVVLFPRNPRKIVFGAWGGRQFSCNPKYLFQYLAPRGEFVCVWVGDEALRDEVLKTPCARFARKGSLAALWHCLTARIYAYNINWREDVIDFPRCRRVDIVYLTHGYASKYVGVKQFSGHGEVKVRKQSLQFLRDALNKLEDWLFGYGSWCSESSAFAEKIGLANQPFIMSPEKMLGFGKPRADYFIWNRDNDAERLKQKEKIAQILGISSNKKWYVFVPTWRHDCAKVFSFTAMNHKVELRRLLANQDAVIIEKQHPLVLRMCDLPFGFKDNVIVVSPEQSRRIDTQELMMASDRMITDYSSVYNDFVLLNRPVIHYAPDYEDFTQREMGYNFDIRQYGGGPFAYNEDELLDLMRLPDDELLRRRSPLTLREHLTYEKGVSCESFEKFFRTFSSRPDHVREGEK